MMRTLVIATILVAATPAAIADPPDAVTPVFEITELDVRGGVDLGLVQRALDESLLVLSRCYEKAPTKPTGSVMLRFRIEDKGAAAGVSAAGIPSLNACVTSGVKALAFAAPRLGKADIAAKIALHVRTAGILGSQNLDQGGKFQSLTGSGDVSSGFDDASRAGGPRATRPTANVSIGQPSATGDLDKAIIRRYIKRKFSEILVCYEKELLDAPKLAGNVTVRFRIGSDGKVSSATGTGLARVDECVARVIQNIEFPRPADGGPVDVSYPFLFSNGS